MDVRTAANRGLAKFLSAIGLLAYGSSGFGLTVLGLGIYQSITERRLFFETKDLGGLLIFIGFTIVIPLALGFACRFTAHVMTEQLRNGTV